MPVTQAYDTRCYSNDQKLTWISLICRTEPKTKKVLREKLKSKKRICSEVPANKWQLPDRISRITDCNFTIKMLYRNMYWLLYISNLCFILVHNCGLTVRNKRICYVIVRGIRGVNPAWQWTHRVTVSIEWIPTHVTRLLNDWQCQLV